MSHLTTSSALGARPALAHAPVLATRRLSAASWLAIAFFAGALLFGAVALAMGDVFYLRLATEALIFGGLALSVDLLLGRVGLLPLGQALFFGLGAYVSALVLKHWADSLWLALGVALVFSALAGLIGGLIAIRSKGVYFALISFGLAQVVSKFVYNTRELGASDGIIGVPAASLAPGVTSGTPEVFFLLVLAFIGALYLGLRYLMNTPMGRQLDAIVHHPQYRDLETSWRALKFLVDRTPFRAGVVLEVLHAPRAELVPALAALDAAGFEAEQLCWVRGEKVEVARRALEIGGRRRVRRPPARLPPQRSSSSVLAKRAFSWMN